MRKLFLFLVVFVLAFPFAVSAQDGPQPTVEEVIRWMRMPDEDGIPASHITDTRYHCEQLIGLEVCNDTLGICFAVKGEQFIGTRWYFDSVCSLIAPEGRELLTGALPIYEDDGVIYMDASVISGALRLTATELVSTNVVVYVTYAPIPSVNYMTLEFDRIDYRDSPVNLERAIQKEGVWWQMRLPEDIDHDGDIDERDAFEYRLDESTWDYVMIFEVGDELFGLLPGSIGYVVEVRIGCAPGVAGGYGLEVMPTPYCGEQSAAEYFDAFKTQRGLDAQRYGGIVMYVPVTFTYAWADTYPHISLDK